jgi:hypothetical protein
MSKWGGCLGLVQWLIGSRLSGHAPGLMCGLTDNAKRARHLDIGHWTLDILATVE